MKYHTIIASTALGLFALVSTGCVTDGGYAGGPYANTYQADNGGDFRQKVRHLREHYARVRDEATYRGASRRVRGELVEINDGIDRVASFVFSGEFIPERAQENITRLHGELRGISDEMRQ